MQGLQYRRQNFNFSVKRNPSYILVTGMVQNSTSGDGLANIAVTVIAATAINTDPVLTDANGLFRIPVQLDQLENQNAVRLQVRDPSGRNRPLRSIPDLYQITSFNTIQMEARNTQKISVNGYKLTRICFKEGNVITIEASGQIRVGRFVGNSDPDGRSSGVFNLALESYNIVSDFNHAALLYRISGGNQQWQLVGRRRRFIAPRDGCLEFEVNDNNKTDNYGAYDLEVTITGS
jgi:hypothetical protein